MAESKFDKGVNTFSTVTPDTIQITVIWKGKLKDFKVAAGDSVKLQKLYTVGKLNEVLDEMDTTL